MLILAIDTSTQCGSVAALRAEQESAASAQVLRVLSSNTDEPYSSRLFRHIEFLLDELGVQTKDFDLFAVSAGPGSFTGLRVGLTAAKAWAEVHSKPLAAVSSLEALAVQAGSPAPLLAPVMDARRGQVFGGLYQRRGSHLERLGDEVVMTAAEFLQYLQTLVPAGMQVAFVSPAPEVCTSAMEASPFRGSAIETVSAVLAAAIGKLGYERAQRGELVNALTLDANYIRRSDAELLWKG